MLTSNASTTPNGDVSPSSHITLLSVLTGIGFLFLFFITLVTLKYLWSVIRPSRPTPPPQPIPAIRGVPSSVLDGIPVVVIADQSETSINECFICLESFEIGQQIKILPQCRHEFHSHCTYSWFAESSMCPLCRAVVQ